MPGKVVELWRHRNVRWGAVILGLALAVRLLALTATWDEPLQGDALFYSSQARTIAAGDGYTDPFAAFRADGSIESADHPPLFVTYLAAWTKVGVDTAHGHRIVSGLLGLGTVALIAALGFLLGGRRTAIVAGLFAAVWPSLWYWDVGVQSESISALAVAASSVAGMWFLRRPSAPRLALVGATVGLAALGRSELLLLAVVVPLLVLVVDGLTRARRARWIAAGAVAIALVLAPWTIYNLTRFDRPVLLSNGLGLVLVSSNCDTTYYGDSIGYWWFGCSVSGSKAAGVVGGDDQSTEDRLKRDVAVAYAGDHLSRTPAVATARGARFLGLWPPGASAELAATNEGMSRGVFLAIQASWLAALGFAVVAVRRARHEGRRLLPVLAPPIVGLLTALLVYGIVRFRAPIEPPLVALAAMGAVVAWDRLRERHAPPARPTASRPAPRIVRRPAPVG
jgi:4-amino-4-deoxy-L-arabinose transferase-like glycosyltransferase